MRRRLRLALLGLPLLLGAATLTAVPTAQGAVTCPATTLTRTGAQTSGIYTDNSRGTWSLGGASWTGVAPSPLGYPIRSEHWTQGCILGGAVHGDVPRTATRDQWYDGSGGTRMGGEVFRQTLNDVADNFLYMRDNFASDFEDAYDPNGYRADSLVHLDHVRAEYIRDDCVENEGSGSPQVPMSMVISNSLLDGCFTAFASRPPGSSTAQNGTGAQTFEVRDSLVYVQPQPLGPLYCNATRVTQGRCRTTSTSNVWLGSYGIWKWSDKAAAKVTIRNTVFRLDMPSYSSCQSQKWPAGTYENVTLVWTGSQAYGKAGACTNTLPAGVTLTTDVTVWDKAKAAWLAGTSTTPTTTTSTTTTPTTTTTTSTTTTSTTTTKTHGGGKTR